MPEHIVNQTTVKGPTDISVIRERNQAEIRRRSATDRTVEALEVFGVKAIAAHLSGVPLANAIIRQQADEIVRAVEGITREAVN